MFLDLFVLSGVVYSEFNISQPNVQQQDILG